MAACVFVGEEVGGRGGGVVEGVRTSGFGLENFILYLESREFFSNFIITRPLS